VADGGLPVGAQIVAPFGDDARALAAARFVEAALAGR
jgi:Asp-tRNA(Asn)/Glu-tRNA(Gln) amidotransferase A subunit family amidase